jgi:pantothenate kinase type III
MRNPDVPNVIAIDIGSTRTHVGLIDPGNLTCRCRTNFLSTELPNHLLAAIDRAMSASGKSGDATVVIGGGRTTLSPIAEKIAKSAGATQVTHVEYHPNLPIAFHYDKPETLGADRIAHALYARAAYPEQNAIIICSGTAITVDAISHERGFLGGAIMPGVDAQLQSLHSATGVLPRLSMPENEIPFPGNSTEFCMLTGVSNGIAGALNALVRKYQVQLGGNDIVLATGGAWRVTEKIVDFAFAEIPDMTLIGTGLFTIADCRLRIAD